MRYYKILETIEDKDYIMIIGTGNVGTQISKREYDKILTAFHNKPMPPEGYDYYLVDKSLEWDLIKIEGDED